MVEKTFSPICYVAVAIILGAIATSSYSADLPVGNFSFETPDVLPGNFQTGSIPSWTSSGNFGVFNGGEFGQAAAATHGAQIAFFNVGDADARQTLASTYTAASSYTLTLDISARTPLGANDDMNVIFYAGGDVNNVIAKRRLTGAMVPSDVFNTFTLTAPASAIAAAGAAGQSIGVRLFSEADGPAADFDLDNLRVTQNSVAPVGLTNIGIANHSFEVPDVGPGAAQTGSLPGWSSTGNFGVFNAGEFGQLAPATDGSQIAFFNVGDANATQVLGATYQANSDYVLSVDISARSPLTATADMDLILFADGNPNNIVGSMSLVGTEVPADDFNTFRLTVTAADVLAAGAVGDSIGIRFFSGNDGGGGDFDLDNVRLVQVQALPEPVSIAAWLIVFGLAVSWGWQRRRATRGTLAISSPLSTS